MADVPSLVLTGFHGTDVANVPSIQATNFRCSDNTEQWLGPGAYFFGEGISNPEEDAREWVHKCAFDRGTRKYKYSEYAILKVSIRPGKLLDLNTDAGKRAVNYARQRLLERIHIRPGKNEYHDGEIVKFLVATLEIDVVVVDMYVRSQEEIAKKINSRIANVRLICVCSPIAIDPSTIEVVCVSPFESHDL